jgi:hypothetical protein
MPSQESGCKLLEAALFGDDGGRQLVSQPGGKIVPAILSLQMTPEGEI